MSEAKQKSRTFRRVSTRVPSGKAVMHYVRKKPARAQCASCGVFLLGVPRGNHGEFRSYSKTERRPSRPYGGVLCSRCTRQEIANRFRGIFSLSKK